MTAAKKSKAPKLVPLLLTWFATNARDLPWRRTHDPYAIWVSEIMLQQTQVKTVIPFWNRWMRELPTIDAAAKAPSARIHKLWEGLGYYTRVRNLQKAAQVIVTQHGGKFPEHFDEVLALPGIGRYTAGAICSIAFNQPAPILDGNVIRVLTRIFGIADNPKEKATNVRLWHLAEELVMHAARLNSSRSSRREEAHSKTSKGQSLRTSAATIHDSCSAFNQSLMELGALVCTPRNPQCLLCPVKKSCVAFKEKRTGELPSLDKRATATARHFIAFAIEHKGKFLVRQRPTKVVNALLWEFPNVETGARLYEPQHVISAFNALGDTDPRSKKLEPLCTVKHSITRYRITLEAFHVDLGGASSTSPLSKIMSEIRGTRPFEMTGIWRTPAQLRRLAFTGAHKQILGSLEKRC